MNRREALAALSAAAFMPLRSARSRHRETPSAPAAAGAGAAAKAREAEAAKLLDAVGENLLRLMEKVERAASGS